MDQRPWFSSYPAGVPRSIDPERYRSVAQLALTACRRGADRCAFINLGTELSYSELDEASRNFSAYLVGELGLERGDRVAVMLPNLLQSPIVLLGILRAGLVAVNVNPLYTAPELEHQLGDSGARAIVVLENFAATVAEARAGSAVEWVIVTRLGDALPPLKRVMTNLVVKRVKRMVPRWRLDHVRWYRDALATGARSEYEDPELGPDDIAFLQYTGGTTGVSKGAMLTHRNMVSNVLQLVAWVDPFIDPQSDLTVTALPLYHIFALTVNMFAFMELGAANLLITNPRDLRGLTRELKRRPFAFFTGVNTLFNALLHTDGFDDVDFSGLKVTLAGGMAVQQDVAASWKKLTGVTIAQGYGLTEASPVVTANPMNVTEFTGSIGLPLPSTDVAIWGAYDQPLAAGEVGEICVRGPQVMRGYWRRDDDTRVVKTEDGWLRTGDVGRMDEDGYVFIEDRKKDIIIVSGFNVYPNEVENVVTSHPGVLEAAAIGVPDERSGEAVKVFVVRKDPNLTDEAVIEHCRQSLTGYKTPDIVEFVDELPKTNVGKILRRALKETG